MNHIESTSKLHLAYIKIEEIPCFIRLDKDIKLRFSILKEFKERFLCCLISQSYKVHREILEIKLGYAWKMEYKKVFNEQQDQSIENIFK